MTPLTFESLDQNWELGNLAMEYRGTLDPERRAAVAKRYAAAVDRLIQSGTWQRYPRFEDQLPDEDMPPAFDEYWDSMPAE